MCRHIYHSGPMATYQSERDVKRDVRKVATAGGWWWWMPPANAFGASNVDFNALRAGYFLAIETKFGTNPLTPRQRQFLQKVLDEGGTAVLVTEQTLPLFTQWMSQWPVGGVRPPIPAELLA